MPATTKARRKAAAIAIEAGTQTTQASVPFRKPRKITVPGSAIANCIGAIFSSPSRGDTKPKTLVRFVTIAMIAMIAMIGMIATTAMTGTAIGIATTATAKAEAAIGTATAPMAGLTRF